MFRNRWVRRVGAVLAALLVLGVVGLFGYRHRTRQAGEDRYAEIVAHLDATDPGWRLDAGDEPRPPVPADQNSALLAPRVKAALAGGKFEVRRGDGSFVYSGGPPNRHPTEDELAAVDRAFEGNYAALAIARSYKDAPHGWRTPPPGRDVLNFTMDDVADTRLVLTLLNEEAKRLARDGRPGAAFEFVRAMLNAVRSIDGHILWVDALVHLAGDSMVVGRVQGVLAVTRPRGDLSGLQAALAEEAESDFLWRGFRGERALLHRTFINIRAGKYPYKSALALDEKIGKKAPGPEEKARDRLEEPKLPAEHAAALETSTKLCDLGKLPTHQQRAALRAIVDGFPPTDSPAGPRQLFSTADKLLDAGLRCKAQLRCAVLGVALERYRQRTGRWPAFLDEVPKDLVSAIPLDPFDGKPLKYVHRADGVTLYSIGPDGQDNGGEPGDNGVGNKPGTDVCFRLYDPDQRGLPPLPAPPRSADDEPEQRSGPPVGPEPRVIGDGP